MPKYTTSSTTQHKMDTALADYDKNLGLQDDSNDSPPDLPNLLSTSFKEASKITAISEKKRDAVERVKQNYQRLMTENLQATDVENIKTQLEQDKKILAESDTKLDSVLGAAGTFVSSIMRTGSLLDAGLATNAYQYPPHNFTANLVDAIGTLQSDLKEMTPRLSPLPQHTPSSAIQMHPNQENQLNPYAPSRAIKTDQEYITLINHFLNKQNDSTYSIGKQPIADGFVIRSSKNGAAMPNLDVTVSADKKVSANIPENATAEEKEHLVNKLVATYMVEHNPKSLKEVKIHCDDPELKAKIMKELTAQISAHQKNSTTSNPSNKGPSIPSEDQEGHGTKPRN